MVHGRPCPSQARADGACLIEMYYGGDGDAPRLISSLGIISSVIGDLFVR